MSMNRIRLAGAAVIAAFALGATAQDDEIETVTVTGTRLSRSALDESASSIVVVPATLFQQSSAASVERTLNELPQFVPMATGTSNAPGNDGQANISLRGLSPLQTLVLLDGRRLMPADGRGSVDLNVLPPALIERVDVITGGASAVYGSDAIAGVVNFKLKDRFEGVQVDGGWSQTAQGDGEEYTTSLTAGTAFADGRGTIMGYLGYTERDQINQDARQFSAYPLRYFADEHNGFGPHQAFLVDDSGGVQEGHAIVFANPVVFQNLFAGYGYPAGTVPYWPAISLNADGTVFTQGNDSPGSVANFRGAKDPVLFNDRSYYEFNSAPTTALQMPLERTSVFSHARFAFSESLEAYAQVLAANYTVTRQLTPVTAGITLIPATNPHISADLATLVASRTNPSAPFRSFKRLTELGPRVADNERDMVQVTTGATGALSSRWTYDAYVQFGRNERTEQQSGNAQLSKIEALTFAADGGASICGDFNPFAKNSLTAACAAYVALDASNKVTVEQTLGEISVDGPLWTLPAGELRAAFGVVHKNDQFDFNADPILSAQLPGVPGVIGPRPDIAGFEAAVDRSGSQNNTDIYTELLIPLLRDLPYVQSLEAGLGYRYSDYNHAGGVSSYKADLSYRPDGLLRVRSSYQHTVRAPSVEELFYPPVSGQFVLVPPDPCDAKSAQRTGPDRAQVEALCLAQGLPAALLPGFTFPLARVDGVSGGNPDLDPEQADTYTVGVVLTPEFGAPAFGDLQVAIDWYRIDIEDGIGRWQSDSAVARCFDPAFNPTYSLRNVYCTFFERQPDTGQIYALILDRNIGGLRTSGVDLQIDWGLDAGPGRLSVNENLTYVDVWQYRDPGGGKIEYVGTIGGDGLGRSLPQWKSLLNIDYRLSAFTLFAKWQHIDSMRDVEYTHFKVPARDYFGLSASYEIESGTYRGLTARAGIENVFDEDPPIFPSWQQANTDPSQYDVLGRRYFFSLSYRV